MIGVTATRKTSRLQINADPFLVHYLKVVNSPTERMTNGISKGGKDNLADKKLAYA